MAEQVAVGVERLGASVEVLGGEILETRPDAELALAERFLSRIVRAEEEACHDQVRITALGDSRYVRDEASRARHGFKGYADRFEATPEGANEAAKAAKFRLAAHRFMELPEQADLVHDLLERTRREQGQRAGGVEVSEHAPPPPEVEQWFKEFRFQRIAQNVLDLRRNVAEYLPSRYRDYSISAPSDIEPWYREVEEARYARERLQRPNAAPPDPSRDLAIYWEMVGGRDGLPGEA